jgi:hypothetical protein
MSVEETTVTETTEQTAAAGEQDGTSTEGTSDSSEGADSELSFANLLKKSATKAKTPEQPAEVPAPAYEPNYKFRVKDKEFEFEDWAKGVVKDKETEEKIRDFHAKAYGLDAVKQAREAAVAELQDLKSSKETVDTALKELGTYRANKDWDSFFEALDVPKQDILKYAVELVQRDQWTPEQRAQWQQSREAMNAAKHYQVENQQLLARQQQLSVQQRSFELEQALVQPEVVEVAQNYDAGTASPGAFRQFVIQIGQAHAARGEDISAAEAVAEATKHLRAVMAQNAAVQQQAATPKVVMPHQKPVIPNIQGRGTSPIRSTPKSFADLRKRGKELEAQEA